MKFPVGNGLLSTTDFHDFFNRQKNLTNVGFHLIQLQPPNDGIANLLLLPGEDMQRKPLESHGVLES
jgi:hypothetical protein